MDAIALVDYDNVCNVIKPEKSSGDVAINLEEFLMAFSLQAQVYLKGLESVVTRFYGGWYDRGGGLTDRGRWVQGELPRFRTRLNRLRIIPTMVSGIFMLPERNLIGTYRSDLSPSQKLVDGMLTVDSIELGRRESVPILIVSDDDDFVPAAIVTQLPSAKKSKVYLFRRSKPQGIAPNDGLLADLNIQIATC